MANKKDPRIKEYLLKDGSKRYMFRVYAGTNELTGKKEKITRKGFASYNDANQKLKRLEYEIATHSLPKKVAKKTFRQLYDTWFDNYKLTVKESTWALTDILFQKHILPTFGNLLIDKIDIRFCQKVINRWSKEKPNRFIRYKNYVSNVLDYAVSIEMTSDNPMKKIQVPKGELVKKEEREFTFYSKEELLNFLDKCEQKLDMYKYVFFYLLSFSGLRKSEALALKWNDVDFKKKTLTIDKTVARGNGNTLLIQSPKTKKSARIISLDDSTLQLLKKHKLSQRSDTKIVTVNQEDSLVFCHFDQSLINPSAPKDWIRTVLDSEDKYITPHGFRHTHASLLFEAGASMKEVQERLGHADIQTTMNIYTHVTEAKKEETASKFAKFMQKGHSGGNS